MTVVPHQLSTFTLLKNKKITQSVNCLYKKQHFRSVRAQSTVTWPNPVSFTQTSAPRLLSYSTYFSRPPICPQSSDWIMLAHFIAHRIRIIASLVYLSFKLSFFLDRYKHLRAAWQRDLSKTVWCSEQISHLMKTIHEGWVTQQFAIRKIILDTNSFAIEHFHKWFTSGFMWLYSISTMLLTDSTTGMDIT